MFKNSKVRTKLIINSGTIIIFSLIITFVAVSSLFSADNNMTDFVDHSYTSDVAVKNCRIETNIAARNLRDMIIDTDPSKLDSRVENINLNIVAIRENIEKLRASYQKDDGLVDKYDSVINSWIEIAERGVSHVKSGDYTSAKKLVVNECDPALQAAIGVAKELDDVLIAEQATALNYNHSYLIVCIWVIVAVLGISVLLAVILSYIITRSITLPIKDVEKSVLAMSQGNLKIMPTYVSKNEIGVLAEATRSSLKELSIYIKDIDVAMQSLSDGDFNISATKEFLGDFSNIQTSIDTFTDKMSDMIINVQQSSEQVNSGAEQVSDAAQALSQGATEQAASLEKLAETISSISEQINDTALNTQAASKITNEARDALDVGGKQMSEMLDAMAEISEASSKIGNIIKTINDIAFQTNILALNAAVEAARAGTAGKGFAVVADEVRNLAGKSAEAAKSTTELIDTSVNAVDKGSKIASETAKTITDVVTNASQIATVVGKIADASIMQSESAKAVTVEVDQISGVVQTNSATAEESAAASEELSSQAQTLKALMDGFKARQSRIDASYGNYYGE